MKTTVYIKDQIILDYIQSKDNQSKYICDLVRNDMENNKPITRDEIIDMIKKYAGGSTTKDVEKIKNTLTDMFK
jgi:hypothetical protein